MPNLSYFFDRSSLDDLPEALLIEMRQLGLVAPDHLRVHYCGFVSWQDGVAVFMPRNSRCGSRTPENAYYLLQALKRYYLNKTSGVSEGLEGELIGKSSLTLAVGLVDDYLANGVYVRRTRKFSVNTGRPNWKRTIGKQTAYLSGNAPVYLDLETSSTTYVASCETAKIHARVLREIDAKFGVLLLGQDGLPGQRLEQLSEPFADDIGQLAVLDRELSESYSERDIQLIGMLKQYIENSSGTAGDTLFVGTRNFHNVWEGMLDACLPRTKSINEDLPRPFYLQDDGDYYPSHGQRTDTVIVNERKDKWAIIDAKYYAANGMDSVPGWHDLVKQFFYKTAAEEISGKGIEISLHFVFPGKAGPLVNAKVGHHKKTESGKSSTEAFREVAKYGVIHCHYCEPNMLMRKYVDSEILDIDKDKDLSGSVFR